LPHPGLFTRSSFLRLSSAANLLGKNNNTTVLHAELQVYLISIHQLRYVPSVFLLVLSTLSRPSESVVAHGALAGSTSRLEPIPVVARRSAALSSLLKAEAVRDSILLFHASGAESQAGQWSLRAGY
jgi:hypothetical protein